MMNVLYINDNIDNKISFSQFLIVLPSLEECHYHSEEEYIDVFKVFDSDNNGFITVKDLKHALNNIMTIDDKEIDELIKIAGFEGNEQIDYQEFVKSMIIK